MFFGSVQIIISRLDSQNKFQRFTLISSRHIGGLRSSSNRRGRNRIGRREKWLKQSCEEGEIGGKSREEGEMAQTKLRGGRNRGKK